MLQAQTQEKQASAEGNPRVTKDLVLRHLQSWAETEPEIYVSKTGMRNRLYGSRIWGARESQEFNGYLEELEREGAIEGIKVTDDFIADHAYRLTRGELARLLSEASV